MLLQSIYCLAGECSVLDKESVRVRIQDTAHLTVTVGEITQVPTFDVQGIKMYFCKLYSCKFHGF